MFEKLASIADNLWWTWNPAAAGLFRYAAPAAFMASNGNPVAVLRHLSAGRRKALQRDPLFNSRVQRVYQQLQAYLSQETWFDQLRPGTGAGLIAYFCMEYGLHESLPLYAGGLGILAGDHLKSVSDLGLPLIAVGIYWHRGYTQQRIDRAGRQQDRFPELPVANTPFRELLDRSGKPLRVPVQMGKDAALIRAFCAMVGRVPLILLDTRLPENPARHRRIVDVLYSGDRDMRIRQEILLGIGGWRMLKAAKLPVAASHLNEGHAAFLSLERTAERMKSAKETFATALRRVRATTVFTTHTPVPAGNEEFDPALVQRYLGHYADQLHLSPEEFLDLARIRPPARGRVPDTAEAFGMTPLALRTSGYANGVAALHGQTARKMWKGMYPGKPTAKVPIGHVTNGIHLRTWLHPRMGELLDEIFGPGWEARQDDPRLWRRLKDVDDRLLWELHVELKRGLIEFCRQRCAQSEIRKGSGSLCRNGPKGAAHKGSLTPSEMDVLDPAALTIGFARRFAGYKRAALIFTEPARLARILNDPRRPVQILFAGKAHPADEAGKSILRTIANFARQPRFRRGVVLLENYDMQVARHLVAGVDVWLNNPQRPREASGTSGMKPALHGGLNLSILDGWWPEAYNRLNGWAIGTGQDHDGSPAADRRDAKDLYHVLETEVIPTYYHRDTEGLPARWIARQKSALMTIPPVFCSHRQVKEYWTRYYRHALRTPLRQPAPDE